MADVILNPGVGGDTIRTVEKGGVDTQVVILDLGGAGAESLLTGTLPVSGTVAVTGALTDAQLRATPVPVSGTVSANVYSPGTVDVFGRLITGRRINQIDVQFFTDTPQNLTTVTTTNGGSAVSSLGGASFATGTNVSGTSKSVSLNTVIYSAGAEIFTEVTASFTAPTSANSFQRIGLYDDNNGFFFGYEGTTFGVTVRNNAVDTQVAKASFSEDTLVGGASSLFTRAGVPEAIDLTKQNIFRIRFGWQGSAPVYWEVMAPDGRFVTVHVTRQPNLAVGPHVRNPNLPITIHAAKASADATSLVMTTNSWGAGATVSQTPLNSTINTSTLADLNRSVIAGETTAGGGAFVNVKVNPSGTLETNATNGGTFAVQESGAALTALQLIDDAVYTDGTGTVTKGIAVLGQDGTNPQAIKTDADGELQVDVLTMPTVTVQATNLDVRDLTFAADKVDASGTVLGPSTNNIGDVDVLTLPSIPAGNNNIGDVDIASIAAGDNNIGNVDIVTLPSLPAGTNNIGDVDVLTLPATPAGTNYIGKHGISDGTNDLVVDTVHGDAESNTENHIDVGSKLMGFNGTTWDRLRADITNGLDVDVTRLPSLVAGTAYVGKFRLTDGTLDSTLVDETGASAVDALPIGGGTPHDSVNSGNPILNGHEAIAHGTNPTAVAAADRTKSYANRAGIPFVIGGHPNIVSVEYYTTALQTDDDMIGAISAGSKIIVTQIAVIASAANTVNASVRIGFGTATVPAQGASGAAGTAKVILSHPNIPPGSGITKGNGSGIVGIGGDGEELRITCSAPTTGSLIVQIDYYLIES
jgi:hypothetical protein